MVHVQVQHEPKFIECIGFCRCCNFYFCVLWFLMLPVSIIFTSTRKHCFFLLSKSFGSFYWPQLNINLNSMVENLFPRYLGVWKYSYVFFPIDYYDMHFKFPICLEISSYKYGWNNVQLIGCCFQQDMQFSFWFMLNKSNDNYQFKLIQSCKIR